jgi:hypothetical protein
VPKPPPSAADTDAMVARVAPAILELLADGVPRSRRAIVAIYGLVPIEKHFPYMSSPARGSPLVHRGLGGDDRRADPVSRSASN